MTVSRSRFETVWLAVAVGVGGYLAVLVWAIVLLAVARAVTAPVEVVERQFVNAAALLLGTVLAVRVYLAHTDRSVTYLDFEWPTPQQVGLGLVSIPVLYGIGVIAGAVGIAPAEHGLADAVRAGGIEVAVVLAATSLVVVGPAEEVLYRNIVQKTLAEQFSPAAAISGASVVFAAVHTTAYWGESLAAFGSALGLVFVLSLLLGVLYEVTDRVAVPALAHGGYDAVVFLLLATDPLAV